MRLDNEPVCVQHKEGWADKDELEAGRGAVDFDRLSRPEIFLKELLDGEDLKAFETRYPPWRQHRGKWMVYLVNSHTNATSQRQHLLEIDLRVAPGLPPGWHPNSTPRPCREGVVIPAPRVAASTAAVTRPQTRDLTFYFFFITLKSRVE